jgi:hypothetical protein
MKRILLACALISLCLIFSPERTTKAIGDGPSANGNFQFVLEDGTPRYLQFEARIQGDTARGSMTYTDPAGAPAVPNETDGAPSAQVTAQFDCAKIDGNRAVMGGIITSSNIAAAINRRVLLVVEDNGEGVNAQNSDRLTWGIYDLPATSWIPVDAEREDDNGASLTWIATDAERQDDVGIPSKRDPIVRCTSFPLSSYSFVNVGHGNGNIQVKP